MRFLLEAGQYRARYFELGELRERQAARGLGEQEPQRAVAASGELRQQAGYGDRPARHLHLGAGCEARIVFNLTQREHRDPDGPQTETAYAGLLGWNQQCVLECVAQMRMGDTDELAQAGAEARVMGRARQVAEIDAVTSENLLRQPTGAAAAILPHILED